jgi:hypothetical protein
MKRRTLLAGASALSLGAAAEGPAVSPVQSIGPNRFRIGRIEVDKAAGRFTVPGRVLVTGKALEYLATSPGGMKAYESLFELHAGGTEFNLACILLGLERDATQVPIHLFRQEKTLKGPRLRIDVSWGEGEQRQSKPAAALLLNPEAGVAPEAVEWIYVGSPASDGRPTFAAQDTGTLIGFSHDANCIIEAATAVGLGAYGTVRGHASAPPIDTAITLSVGLWNTNSNAG